MKIRNQAILVTALLSVVVAFANSILAQTNLLRLDHQWADSVNGPWTKPPSSQTYVQPDGSLLTLATNGHKFFRLSIQEIEFDDIQSPVVPVVQLERETVSIAESHLQWLAANSFEDGREDPEGLTWTNARLAPVALKVFDPAYQKGAKPAYIEFKVISGVEPATTPIGFLENKEAPSPCDLGHILVALHDSEAPVAQFSQEGATPCEELLGRVDDLRNIRIMRYGPAFSAIENERGELLANAGTAPFRLPDDLFTHDRTFMGEFDSETADEPPANGYGGPVLKGTPYRSYAEFKTDYTESPIYQEFRRRKALAVAPEWMLLRGGSLPEPPVVSVRVGEWIHAFESQTVTRYFLDDDEAQDIPLATIDDNTGGDGLAIRGERAGSAPFTVEIGGRVTQYELQVTLPRTLPASGPSSAAGAGFTPGWQPPRTWVVGDGWTEQPRYWQTSDSEWCPKVGCGPVAWAILFAWWDRNGVPACFYSNIPGDFSIRDAPFRHTQYTSKIRAVYRDLHDYCDVWCLGEFSDQGATMPGDMVEGGPSYLWIPKVFGRLAYKYVWAWDLSDPDWSQPSSRIRYANKSGLPAIAGWYWHYAVSYAYRERVFKLSPNGPVLFRKRLFKCNMGFRSEIAKWYSGDDMIFGAYINPRQK